MEFGVGKCSGLQELRGSKAKGIGRAVGEPLTGRAEWDRGLQRSTAVVEKCPFNLL